MLVLITIFIIIYLIQITLAYYAWSVKSKLKKKYSYPLSSQMDLTKSIEIYVDKYIKQEEVLHIYLDSHLNEPAFSEQGRIALNKNYLYNKTLYPNFFMILQAELAKSENYILREILRYQNIIYFFQLLFFIIGIFVDYQNYEIILILIAILIQIFLIFLSIYVFFLNSSILNRVRKVSKKILKLDEVEYARTLSLKEDLQYSAFEYPLEIFGKIFEFFIP
jgi:hypothetical protein